MVFGLHAVLVRFGVGELGGRAVLIAFPGLALTTRSRVNRRVVGLCRPALGRNLQGLRSWTEPQGCARR
jgi:hypothetical protein